MHDVIKLSNSQDSIECLAQAGLGEPFRYMYWGVRVGGLRSCGGLVMAVSASWQRQIMQCLKGAQIAQGEV